ncbi:phosphoglycerate mutase-like protein [Crassisporium funariophilum]|nr:phosphoglycerate mutase-like protein [Crassisporium funariophilum]
MSSVTFSSVLGYFAQDQSVEPPLPAVRIADGKAVRWTKLLAEIRKLNEDASKGTKYKLFLLSRHGQGYHNVGEAKYGSAAWDAYWSKLNGDGEIVWGPDPQLTPVGVQQAHVVQDMWKIEAAVGLPGPHMRYCSPLTRAMHTCDIIFEGSSGDSDAPVMVLENCREENGVHTCDKRNTRTYIASAFPHFSIEDGFTELDELWDPEIRESKAQVAQRARKVLEYIFAHHDVNDIFISLTAHGGFINGFLAAVGRVPFPLPTGGVLPVVVKVEH